MHHHYYDIRSRIAEDPKWYDEYAVPRYDDFSPDDTADIYCSEVALVEIACQDCGTRFRVCFSWSRNSFQRNKDGTVWLDVHEPMTLERVKKLHYGDPPNTSCCPAGATMNSIPLRVLEFWRKHDRRYTKYEDGMNVVTEVQKYFQWQRVPEFETNIDCEWAP